MLGREGVGERGVCIAITILCMNLNIIPVYVRIFFGGFFDRILINPTTRGRFSWQVLLNVFRKSPKLQDFCLWNIDTKRLMNLIISFTSHVYLLKLFRRAYPSTPVC